MDGCHYEDCEQLKHLVGAMMAREPLLPGVVGYGVRFGQFQDGGDPAVWLYLHVPADMPFDKQIANDYGDLLIHLQQKLTYTVPSRLALVEITAPPSALPSAPALARSLAGA